MKKLLILMIASTGLLLTSCGSNSYPTGSSDNRYPRNTSSYPRDESVITDRDGRVITRDGRVVENARTSRSYPYSQRRQSGYNNNVPSVLRVDDRYARRDNMGRLYFVDRNGYVYRRGNDGYYYLDSKYAQGNRNYRNGDRDYRSGDRDYRSRRY